MDKGKRLNGRGNVRLKAAVEVQMLIDLPTGMQGSHNISRRAACGYSNSRCDRSHAEWIAFSEQLGQWAEVDKICPQ